MWFANLFKNAGWFNKALTFAFTTAIESYSIPQVPGSGSIVYFLVRANTLYRIFEPHFPEMSRKAR